MIRLMGHIWPLGHSLETPAIYYSLKYLIARGVRIGQGGAGKWEEIDTSPKAFYVHKLGIYDCENVSSAKNC